jgi:hypothetical protein
MTPARPATRSASGLAWKKAEQEGAKKRMAAGGGDKKSGKEMFPYLGEDTGQSRDKIGERVGVSGKSIDKIESGELSVNAVGVATSSNEDDRQVRLQA